MALFAAMFIQGLNMASSLRMIMGNYLQGFDPLILMDGKRSLKIGGYIKILPVAIIPLTEYSR
jgi:hypothetical protein